MSKDSNHYRIFNTEEKLKHAQDRKEKVNFYVKIYMRDYRQKQKREKISK